MLQSVFLTKLLTSSIIFSTAVRVVLVAKSVILDSSPVISFILALRAAVVAKLVILGISTLTSIHLSPFSFILALREALVAKLVISDILSSIVLILTLYIYLF